MNNIDKLKVKLNAFVFSLLALLCFAPCRANPITRMARRFSRDNKGFSAVLVSIIIVVVAAIVIMLAAVVLSKVASSIDRTGLSAAANSTLDAAETQGYGALNLLTIVLIVGAAVAIIGAVMGIFAYIRMKQ